MCGFMYGQWCSACLHGSGLSSGVQIHNGLVRTVHGAGVGGGPGGRGGGLGMALIKAGFALHILCMS